MGKIKEIIHEELLDPIAEKNCNLLRIYRAPNNEVTIHIRNLKIVLHTKEEQDEWRNGFKEALINFKKL